ncbi:GntR family transcriptional regulator [Leucobacter denitrificans]|uniref:GntR family transcriptional regulator n=1 Tax=Leucobacter denitrificans TaxID=683042 RepID=A0A7G9S2Q4_9MICO|nr:GntR family transcriptional regulator [Leucobacter denitrificans]QNN62129.1 GntR family transcriptional regulator [Leucobacter denitrificans]
MQIDDSRPIWAQLVDEFRRRIAAGEWEIGAKVPSVRELALELGVNPNTVQKALGEVDRLGLTTTERTAGRFVTSDQASVSDARAELATTTADGYVHSARGLGMSLRETTDLLAERWAVDEAGSTKDTETTKLSQPEREDER